MRGSARLCDSLGEQVKLGAGALPPVVAAARDFAVDEPGMDRGVEVAALVAAAAPVKGLIALRLGAHDDGARVAVAAGAAGAAGAGLRAGEAAALLLLALLADAGAAAAGALGADLAVVLEPADRAADGAVGAAGEAAAALGAGAVVGGLTGAAWKTAAAGADGRCGSHGPEYTPLTGQIPPHFTLLRVGERTV